MSAVAAFQMLGVLLLDIRYGILRTKALYTLQANSQTKVSFTGSDFILRTLHMPFECFERY